MKSKPLTLLLSFIIAFGLWAYVVTVVSPESEETFYDVPVVLNGTSVLAERDLMILSNTQMTVDLKLMGNRMDLAKLNSGNITVLADLSRITEPGTHNVKYAISYPGGIQSGNVEVLEQNPQYLTIEVVERGHKQIPVVPIYDLEQLGDDYWMDEENISLSYNFITITGPKSEVEKINHAEIKIDLTGKTSVLVEDYRISLCDATGPIPDVGNITVNVGTVQATVLIHEIKEIPIRVDLKSGDVVPADKAAVSLNVPVLKVTGSKEALALLGNEILLDTIDLTGKYEDFTQTFQIELPDGIILLEGSTTVEATVTLTEKVVSRTFWAISHISLMRVPADLNVEITTTSLDIKVMGLESVVGDMTQGDISLLVDCNGIDVNTRRLQVTVKLQNADGVIVVGTYMVDVIVSVPQPEEPEA